MYCLALSESWQPTFSSVSCTKLLAGVLSAYVNEVEEWQHLSVTGRLLQRVTHPPSRSYPDSVFIANVLKPGHSLTQGRCYGCPRWCGPRDYGDCLKPKGPWPGGDSDVAL